MHQFLKYLHKIAQKVRSSMKISFLEFLLISGHQRSNCRAVVRETENRISSSRACRGCTGGRVKVGQRRTRRASSSTRRGQDGRCSFESIIVSAVGYLSFVGDTLRSKNSETVRRDTQPSIFACITSSIGLLTHRLPIVESFLFIACRLRFIG